MYARSSRNLILGKRAHAQCTRKLDIKALVVGVVLCSPSQFVSKISPLLISSGNPSLPDISNHLPSFPPACVCAVLRHACVIRPPSFMKCDASSTSSATTHPFTPTLQALSSSMPLSLSLSLHFSFPRLFYPSLSFSLKVNHASQCLYL